MKKYCYSFIFPGFLKKCWFWFTDPRDVKGSALVNFFSYNNIDKQDFHKKGGLTSIIDLQQPLDTIWSGMRKKFICKQIKRGESNGIVVKQDYNFKEYERIYKLFRKKNGLHIDTLNIFKKNGILFSAYYNDNMIAGGIFISDGKCIRAWSLSSLRNTTDNKRKEIIGQANRMVIWHAVKHAHKTGHKLFDLGGVSPDSKDKGLRTLAEFKESFGGVRKECFYYYKVYSPILKLWMRLRGFKHV